MRYWVKFSFPLVLLFSFFSAGAFSGVVSGARIEQWLKHRIDGRQWSDPLPEPSRNSRNFDQSVELNERSKRAHRIADGIVRNTFQEMLLVAAPETVSEVKQFSDNVANNHVTVSETPGDRSELHYGYNLFDDVARAEYSSTSRNFGVQLENVMVWDDPRRIVRLRCFGEQVLDARGTRASATYLTVDRTLTLGLQRPLSRDVAARFEVVSSHRGGANMAFAQAGLTLMIQTTSL